MSRLIGPALERLRARRGRSLLAALGIAAASMMVGTAVTVSFGLATGFERATDRADLPDLIARFQPAGRDDVAGRVGGLANVESSSLRLERLDLGFETREQVTRRTALQIVEPGRRGYAIVDGADVSGRPGEVVVERGFAEDFDLQPGDQMYIDTLGVVSVVGVAVAPDDVAYPLASRARAWVAADWLPDSLKEGGNTVNVALLWAHDPTQLDPLLVQARTVSFGLENPRFVTEGGVRALVSQAAGIVIALLIAFSVVALATAAIALGSSARADVQRRLQGIGVMRAVGLSRRSVATRYAADAALVAVPAALIGLAAGVAVAYGPSARLLTILSELSPGAALLAPLAGCLALIVLIVVGGTVWPAWRAAGLPPAETLRGIAPSPPARRSRAPGGPFGLGIRLATARRVRTVATSAVIATAAAVVLLMLALASFLSALQNDPGAIGKRYQVSANLPASSVPQVEAIAGVEAAAPRYEVDGLDAFRLGETLTVVGYPGDHTPFEAPPLAAGRRVAAADEVEVGQGLADALGLSPGATLAVLLPSGTEERFTVVGVVRAIDNEGRVAYVQSSRLLAGDPNLSPTIAVKIDAGADRDAVAQGLIALGATPQEAAGATDRNQAFLGILAGVLRVVALVNGLICLYILVQALAVTAVERRQAIAVLRSAGAGRHAITLVMGGAALAVTAVAIPVAIALETLLLGPLVSRLAAGYATPDLSAGVGQSAIVIFGLLGLAAVAASWVARRAESVPIAPALRDQG